MAEEVEPAESVPVAVESVAVEPVGGEPGDVDEVEDGEPEVAVETKPVAVEPEIAVVPAAAPVPDDDLQRIEGIGPRMSGALVAAGIRTYTQLAAADEVAIRAAIEAAGLRFAPSLTTWARQARLLADGDEDGFADLTRRLVAGRDVGRV